MYDSSDTISNLAAELLKGRQTILQQLQQFRKNPATIVPYLKQRISRYKQFEGTWFYFSKKYKKKAIQVHQKSRADDRIRELIGIILGETQKMGNLESVPKLDQIASKLCQTILPQINNQIEFKPQTSRVLRELLEKDHNCEYPNSVVCLISIGFDQPYESLGNLLIDDGVLSRSNRRALLNPMMKYVGVASIKSNSQKQIRCTVFVLTDIILLKKQIKTNNPYPLIQRPINQIPAKVQTLQTTNTIRETQESMETGRFQSGIKDSFDHIQVNTFNNPANLNQSLMGPVPAYQSFGNPHQNANQNSPSHQTPTKLQSLQRYDQFHTSFDDDRQQNIGQRKTDIDKPILTEQNSVQFRDSNKTTKLGQQHEYYPFSNKIVNNSQQLNASDKMRIQNNKIKVDSNGINSSNQYINSINPFTTQRYPHQ